MLKKGEIFNSTGNGAFVPEESMTIGMLVKVLHSFENNPEAFTKEFGKGISRLKVISNYLIIR